MRTPRLALALLTAAGLTLACSGGGQATPAPKPDPVSQPKPKPAPKPGTAKCSTFKGVDLPLEGGSIMECSATKVVIDHPGGDALALRWEYAAHYKKAGWRQADPIENNPSVHKHPDILLFKAAPNLVTIEVNKGN